MDVRKRSQRQEKRVAKEIGGKVTPASGALWGSKGDARASEFLVECKTTLTDKYILKAKTWLKIKEEALKDGLRTPVMCIEVRDGCRDYNIAVMEQTDFEAYIDDFDSIDFLSDVSHIIKTDAQSCVIRNSPLPVRIDCNWSKGSRLVCNHLVVMRWEDFLYYVVGEC